MIALTTESRIGALARRVAAIATDEVLAAAVECDPRLRLAHVRVLAALEHGPVRASAVAARLGATKQTIGPLVDELVVWGILTREPDPADRRAKLLHPTASGSIVGQRVLAAAEAVEQRWRVLVGPDELDHCRRTLWRLLDGQDRDEQNW
ncbi:hypothetical protein GCM10023147_08050 [Tsukamurella soli]|uniref:HTH marR-type domain-containing protein n=2 Tax=Tsukamurella soli TaxID=644556 RepID=A0ABP8J6B5_9ACTN